MICMKWILNVVINSLCGAYKLKSNSELTLHASEVSDVLSETLKLSQLLWPKLNCRIEFQSALTRIWDVVKHTGMNENSMARDIRLGRKTESDFLAGVAQNFDGFPLLQALHLKIMTTQ